MIRIYNEKAISEIDKLREKGLYNAPFSVLEEMNKVEIKTDTKKLEEDMKESEEASAMAVVEIYEAIDKTIAKAKKDLEEAQSQAIIEIYESIGGVHE